MGAEEGRCVSVCFCACLCMHMPVCMLDLCSHSSESALVTGWRGTVSERRGEVRVLEGGDGMTAGKVDE